MEVSMESDLPGMISDQPASNLRKSSGGRELSHGFGRVTLFYWRQVPEDEVVSAKGGRKTGVISGIFSPRLGSTHLRMGWGSSATCCPFPSELSTDKAGWPF